MTIAEDVITALREGGLTIGVAESLTGGDVVSALVTVPGASQVLLGGIVAYATPVKHSVLGVDADLLLAHGAVHPDVAVQMADGARRVLSIGGRSADVGVATTGVAGPEPQDGQPVGTVHVAVTMSEARYIRSFFFDGDRPQIRRQATDAALTVLAEMLGLRGDIAPS